MRKTVKIMDAWTFTDQNKKSSLISLPHTWNNVDGQDGKDDYFRGTCFYERMVQRPEMEGDRRVYLQFHGVNASARVFFNETLVAEHHNGYSTFRADITDLLLQENRLRVEVDNGKNNKVYPQVADFTFYGGIYRDVELLLVNKTHFDLDYYGGLGLQIDTDTAEGMGSVKVRAYVNPGWDKGFGALGGTRGELAAVFSLEDGQGRQVAETTLFASQMKEIQKGARIRSGNSILWGTAVLQVPEARLWRGIRDPYLYTLRAELVLLGEQEQVLDELTVPVGIRTFSFDPDRGFFLNGEAYPLRGVSRHQDRKGIGNAVSYRQMEQDMELIREIGANTIRLAHYQHNQYFYDLCDKYGMVVWAEIPYISAHMPEGRENTFFQMKELIVQNYNHPCIVTWGISNEITIVNRHKEDMLDNHRKLQKLVKEMDPGRPTTLACYAMCHPFHPVTNITDLVAWNLYLGWYVPGLFFNDWFLKFYHWKYPKRCLGYSEYGAEGMPGLHSAKPKRGDHTEEYQAKYHEYMLNCFERHPFLWATYVWNMFDFAADARDQGGEPGMNHKGLVTFDRKLKKDSFYLYKAWWSPEPFLHLCGKRYEYRTERRTEITVYTNQEQVSLFNNGKLIETKQGKYAFHFRLGLQKENRLEVKSGELTDRAVIYRTRKPRPEYKAEKGKSQNWT